jgi:Fe2+ or Zn2+ uptake regulation protein
MNEVSRSPIARAILQYLLSHPEAQDTLAGIVEWWLPEQKVKTQRATVKKILSQLVQEELLIERKGTDSQLHYRINSERLSKIKVLLK